MSDDFVELPPDEGNPVADDVAALERQESLAPRAVVFEDLTLAQALAYLIWQPRQTARLLWEVLTRDADAVVVPRIPLPLSAATEPLPAPVETVAPEAVEEIAEAPSEGLSAGWREALRATGVWVSGVILALLLALRGGAALYDATSNPVLRARRDPNGAELWLLLAGVLWVGVEMWEARGWLAQRWPALNRRLWERFRAHDLAHLWIAGLLLAASGLLVLALLGVGGLPGATLWVVLTLALWGAVLLGTTAPVEVSAEEVLADAADDIYVVRSVLRTAQVEAVPRAVPAYWRRMALVVPAMVFSILTLRWNTTRDTFGNVTDVVLTARGVLAWALSIGLWVAIVAGGGRWRALAWPRLRWRALISWPGLALLAVMALGAAFRLHALDSTPPEMTSDHIEKLLDALKVHDGYYAVFFANNGGREAFQMYLVALIAGPLGVGFNFTALKLATILEGLLTLPALWWMARQVIGTETERDRQLGHWVGVMLAALVAISSWHVMLSRLGLRIALTPLTVALVIGLLARVIRHARTRDFALLGGVLGAGVYFYQANRMLPALVVVGILLAVPGALRAARGRWRMVGEAAGLAALAFVPLLALAYAGSVLQTASDPSARDLGKNLALYLPVLAMGWLAWLALAFRHRRDNRLLVWGNGLFVAAVVALAIYLPMYHYSRLHEAEFWNRTRGRMFGDFAFARTNEAGQQVFYQPSLSEQIERFWDQRDVFFSNYADALRMFHWQGDIAWINNAGMAPALGPTLGGLAALGLVVWGVWFVRRRDPVWGLLPLSILIMLLPTALTLAYPIENPSFTRASGTIPAAFMIAALPLGLLGWRLSQLDRGERVPTGRLLGIALLALVLWQGIGPEWERYFTDYRVGYSRSWRPYREISQPLREFAHGEGSFGNAYVIAYPHWLDHRILGTMAGDIRWPNSVESVEALLTAIASSQGTPYAYDPARPLFVMIHPADTETLETLTRLFPGGETIVYRYNQEMGPGVYAQDEFYIYKVWAGVLQ